MASPVPAKLQLLHNFPLTHLKWKNHRSRLPGEASSSSSQWRESSSSSPPRKRQPSPPNASRRQSRLRKEFPMHENDPNSAGSQFIEKTGKRIIEESSTKSIDTTNNKGKRSNKISFRIRENSKQYDAVAEENHSSSPMDDSVAAEDESSPKTWNLRPRRAPGNHKQSSGGLPMIGASRLQDTKTSHETNINNQSWQLNPNSNSDMRKSKKQKFLIPLSRSEIGEDVFVLTGSKPARRPKKRPRPVQRILDNLFPGLWLDSITADSYKVSEAPLKG